MIPVNLMLAASCPYMSRGVGGLAGRCREAVESRRPRGGTDEFWPAGRSNQR